ncbi:MAG: hypothetical protein CV090_02190 [Nitrospira sp. WS238]|nr:hypothetical protein [Nitrospira sp. WS238]
MIMTKDQQPVRPPIHTVRLVPLESRIGIRTQGETSTDDSQDPHFIFVEWDLNLRCRWWEWLWRRKCDRFGS